MLLKKIVSIYFSVCQSLSIDGVGVSRDTAFQEIRPGAGFETGDFGKEKLGGLPYNDSEIEIVNDTARHNNNDVLRKIASSVQVCAKAVISAGGLAMSLRRWLCEESSDQKHHLRHVQQPLTTRIYLPLYVYPSPTPSIT